MKYKNLSSMMEVSVITNYTYFIKISELLRRGGTSLEIHPSGGQSTMICWRYPGLYSKTVIKGKNKGKRRQEREVENLSPRIVLYTKRGKFATCPSSINKGDIKTTVSLDTK